MSRFTRSVSIALAFGSFVLSTAAAQQTRSLGQAQSVFPAEFGMVSGMRALSDGRLLISDPLGQALMIIDMANGTADTIGGVGAGPEEYKQPDALFRLPGDSTLVTDLGNGRLIVMAPNGQFVQTMSMTRAGSASPQGGQRRESQDDGGRRVVRRGPGGGGGMSFIIPQAVDGEGRVYFRVMAMGGGFGQDSGKVGRWDRGTDRIDTVATFKLQGMNRQTSGGANNQNVRITPMPLSPQDDWTVAPDGRVALVRSGDYRIEWISADGRVTRGEPVRYRPVRVGRAEKERWVANGSSGISIGVSMNNGRRQTTFGRGGGGGQSDINDFEWPDVHPPFVPGRSRVAPDGTLWVERYVAAGADTHFDLFDGTGRHVASVTAPPARRLAGFGDGAVYLVARDEFDLEYLEMYRYSS